MKVVAARIFFLLSLASLAAAKEEIDGVRSYAGYQVFNAQATTKQQLLALRVLEKSDKYDFWTSPRVIGETLIMVSPELIPVLIDELNQVKIEWTIRIPDVGKHAERERAENAQHISVNGSMNWDAYQRWDVIEPWILSLDDYDVATVSIIGHTFEQRNIYMVKVSTGPLPNGANKRVIFIDANIHAREWIAGSTGSWMLNELVTNASSYRDILAELDFYFVPMLNVDGYEYCHTNDRYWRKTRSVNAGSSCRGADPNRNFAFMFGGESTSSDPCSDIYKGAYPYSESEAFAIREALRVIRTRARIWAYITLHSCGQLWLLSWGYTEGVYPDDYPQLLAWGQASVAAIAGVHGAVYRTGQGADMLYGVGGASDDYAKSEGIKYSTTPELRCSESPSIIIPTAEETWAAVLVTARTVMAHK